jgi:Eukaryotic-type carbonic anhydrase
LYLFRSSLNDYVKQVLISFQDQKKLEDNFRPVQPLNGRQVSKLFFTVANAVTQQCQESILEMSTKGRPCPQIFDLL